MSPVRCRAYSAQQILASPPTLPLPSAPQADVAQRYTVNIEYHSGKRDPVGLPAFTVNRGDAQFDSSYSIRKLLLPVDLADAECNGAACGRGKFLVTGVTAHPWHDAADLDGDGTQTAPPLVGFTFMGEAPEAGPWRAGRAGMAGKLLTTSVQWCWPGLHAWIAGWGCPALRPPRLDTLLPALNFRTRPFYAGTPDEPTGVAGISSTAEGTSLTIGFDRPESDTAEVS